MQSRFDPARLAELDNYAVNTPKSVEGTISGLATYLAKPARDDFEKSRLLYRWVAQNIAYDAAAFFSKNLGDQSAEATLRRRTAVCGGYSALFQALGRAAGLEVETVEGWAKGYGYDGKTLASATAHAWTGVRVGGAWHLIDSTWGAGSLNESRQFVRAFEPYYWLTPPEQLIISHFPEDSRWQLLATPVSEAGFVALPELKAGYFSFGLQLPQGTVATTQTVSRATLLIGAPSDVFLSAAVEQNGQRLPATWTFVQRNGAQYEVEAVFPGAGRYTLVIFAKRGTDTATYEGVATLGYDVSQGQATFAGFPKTYLGFGDGNAYLYTPKESGLAIGSSQVFKLRVPKAQDVQIIAGNAWTELPKQGDIFEGPSTITAKPVKVCAAFDSSGNYACLLEWQ